MSRNSRLSVCIIVENNPVPGDRRVWQQARLTQGGYSVSVICPKGPGYDSSGEIREGIEIHRHSAWKAGGRLGYLMEYGFALAAEFYFGVQGISPRAISHLASVQPTGYDFLDRPCAQATGCTFCG